MDNFPIGFCPNCDDGVVVLTTADDGREPACNSCGGLATDNQAFIAAYFRNYFYEPTRRSSSSKSANKFFYQRRGA